MLKPGSFEELQSLVGVICPEWLMNTNRVEWHGHLGAMGPGRLNSLN
jgi:hypothetical protein